MAITAVAVDLGGVLEAIDERREFLDRWRLQPRLSSAEYSRSLLWPLGAADPGAGVKTGGLTESELRERYAAALGLDRAQASEFMADLWDWYCGELDAELAGFVAGLRPRLPDRDPEQFRRRRPSRGAGTVRARAACRRAGVLA